MTSSLLQIYLPFIGEEFSFGLGSLQSRRDCNSQPCILIPSNSIASHEDIAGLMLLSN